MKNLVNAARTGSIGENYMRMMCTSAGYSYMINDSGQDVNAVDLTIRFQPIPQDVQIKCTRTPRLYTTNDRNYFSFHIEDKWKEKWKQNLIPPILVLVIIPDENYLFELSDSGSLLRQTKAYWLRINQNSIPNSVHIPLENLVTEDVLERWETDIIDSFSNSDN